MNLRRTIFGVCALAVLAMAGPQGVDAQIWNEYTLSVVPRIYQNQIARGTIIPRASFVELFSSVIDPDNGVAGPIPIGFPFEYNGQVYTQFYVSVNGWISFRNPLSTGGAGFFGDDPYSLFNNSRPNLTIAPFFGDHYLRTPGFDLSDPQGRDYTPSYIRYVNKPGAQPVPGVFLPDTLVIEWENLNINYRFNPLDPDNPLADPSTVSPQATSTGTFQLWLIQSDTTGSNQDCRASQGDIEFHYGPVSNRGIVKVSGASVGIEDEPAVPGGQTTFMNAVAWLQTGFNFDSLTQSRRLTSQFPPTGFPSQVFRFESNCRDRTGDWGDGDADLTQLNRLAPQSVKDDQRLFVTFADVIRILRHQATRNVDFDSVPGRHAFHGDVNHNGRFFYSTRNYNNTGDSVDVDANVIRYKRLFPTKDVNPTLPFPNDNSFSGFLFDADEFDAALIMTYLAAKLPVLPWLPDTLPHFTGKAVAGKGVSDVTFGAPQMVSGTRVEIPVTFDAMLNGAMGLALSSANGTRILEVRTMPRTDNAWVEAVATENRLALAASGRFDADDVIATIVVEPSADGQITFGNVRVGEQEKGMRKINLNEAVTGSGLSLTQSFPNPFTAGTATTFAYTVPTDTKVNVRIFNVLGREVVTLVDANVGAGTHPLQWNGTDANGKAVATGVYYCRIEANGETRTLPLNVQR